MTELDNYPADRRTAPHGAGAATVVGRTGPDMTMPNNATTEIDPTPDSVWTEDVHGRDVVPDPAVAGSDLNRYGLGPEDVNEDVVPDPAVAGSDLNRYGLGPEDVNEDVVPDPAVAGSDLNQYGLGPEDLNGDVVTPRGRKVHSAPPRETIDAPPHATGDYPLINE